MEDFYPPVLAVALVEGELSWTSAQTHAELKKQQDTFLKNELGKGKDLGGGGAQKNQGMIPKSKQKRPP